MSKSGSTDATPSAPTTGATPTKRHLEVANAGRGVWLVKVPKYLNQEWEKASPNATVGKLRIPSNLDKSPGAKICFDVAEDVIKRAEEDMKLAEGGKDIKIPREHVLRINHIRDQNLCVFSYCNDDGQASTSKAIKLEGHVVEKGECQPVYDKSYMNLKKHALVKAATPRRTVMQIESPVVAFKPIAKHAVDVENEKNKKSQEKKGREDKEKVCSILFSAFGRHQYYAIKDLQTITQQPIPYLKEILAEIAFFHTKKPHQNTWELKPEFRGSV